MSYVTEADFEDVSEEVVKNVISGDQSALTKKMISSTKVQRQDKSVKLSGREQLGAQKATNVWITTNFGQTQKKTKEDASCVV